MRLVRLTLFLLLLVAMLRPGLALAEISLNGSVSNQMRMRILQDYMGDDYDWDVMMLLSTVDVIAKAQNEDRTARMFIDADLRHDPTGVFEDDLEWRLREAYGGYYSTYYSIEIGKRIFSWGMADEFNPTDLINPEDLRWFVTMDKLDRKIGVYSGCLTLMYEGFSFQTVVVPYFEPTLLPAPDSDWLPWQLASVYSITNAFPEYVEYQEDQRPDLTVQNSNVAFRLRGTLGTVDLALTYFDGYDPLPTFDIGINTNTDALVNGDPLLTLRQYYQRYQATGASFAFTYDSFSFRGEGAYYSPRRYMYNIDDSMLSSNNILTTYNVLIGMADNEWGVEKPSWSAAGGIDWRRNTDIYINLQYVHTQILDYEENLSNEENEGMITLKTQTMWLDEDLEVSANGVYNVWQNDWYAKPYIRYKFTTDFTGEFGAQLFDGEAQTQFGDMTDNDFLYTKFKYSF